MVVYFLCTTQVSGHFSHTVFPEKANQSVTVRDYPLVSFFLLLKSTGLVEELDLIADITQNDDGRILKSEERKFCK